MSRRRNDDDDNNEQPDNSGILGRLFGGFGFGDIFSMLFWGVLICTGLYFFAGSSWGQDLMRNLPDSWKVGLSNMLRGVGINFDPQVNPSNIHIDDLAQHADMLGMTAEQVHAVFPTEADLQGTLAIMQAEAHSISADALGNPQVIFRMITEQGATVQRFLANMRPGADGQPNPNMARVLTAVKQIIANDAQVTQLFSAANRGTTLSMLGSLCPIRFGDGKLAAFLTSAGMNGEQPTAQLRAFLNSAIDGFSLPAAQQGAAMQTAFLTFIHDSQKTPQEMGAALAALVAGAQSSDPAQQQLFAILASAQNATATVSLIRALGVEKTQSVLATLAGGDRNAIMALAQDATTTQALSAWANAVNPAELPTNLRPMVALIKNPAALADAAPLIAANIDPQQLIGDGTPKSIIDHVFGDIFGGRRAAYRDNIDHIGNTIRNLTPSLPANQRSVFDFLGTRQRTNGGTPYYVNLIALHNFAEMVGTNPANNRDAATQDRSYRVMHALSMMAAGDNTEFKALPAADIAAFFSAAGDEHHVSNRDAFKALIDGINPTYLPPAARNVIAALRRDWGTGNESGVGHALSTESGAQYILNRMLNPTWTQRDEQTATAMYANPIPSEAPAVYISPGQLRAAWDTVTTPSIWFDMSALSDLGGVIESATPQPAAPRTPPSPAPRLIAAPSH